MEQHRMFWPFLHAHLSSEHHRAVSERSFEAETEAEQEQKPSCRAARMGDGLRAAGRGGPEGAGAVRVGAPGPPPSARLCAAVLTDTLTQGCCGQTRFAGALL